MQCRSLFALGCETERFFLTNDYDLSSSRRMIQAGHSTREIVVATRDATRIRKGRLETLTKWRVKLLALKVGADPADYGLPRARSSTVSRSRMASLPKENRRREAGSAFQIPNHHRGMILSPRTSQDGPKKKLTLMPTKHPTRHPSSGHNSHANNHLPPKRKRSPQHDLPGVAPRVEPVGLSFPLINSPIRKRSPKLDRRHMRPLVPPKRLQSPPNPASVYHQRSLPPRVL
jgi:hypothetical protein